ncbi:MAG TPA: hypothetical protein VFY38_11585 [Pseudonocardia sp.]|nr:hypothetical protein [Pseudonocardia sp.]
MTKASLSRGTRALVVAGIFAAGFVAGSVTQRPAAAQLGELGGKAMEKAGQGGGALGTVAKLGTSIIDMQKEVDGLQKNLETLKQVKSALGG